MLGAAVTLPSFITRSPATVEVLTCFCFANAVWTLQRKPKDEIYVARRALALGLGEDLKGALARGLRLRLRLRYIGRLLSTANLSGKSNKRLLFLQCESARVCNLDPALNFARQESWFVSHDIPIPKNALICRTW